MVTIPRYLKNNDYNIIGSENWGRKERVFLITVKPRHPWKEDAIEMFVNTLFNAVIDTFERLHQTRVPTGAIQCGRLLS